MPSTQAASHGAGHSRPVNSGKLLVACSRSIASRQSSPADQVVPLRDRGCPAGSPWWQNGMPQSMHRPACRSSAAATERLVDLAPVMQPQRRPGAGDGVSRWRGQEALRDQPCDAPSAVRAAAMTASSTSRPSRSGCERGRQHPLVVLRHDLARTGPAPVPVGRAAAPPPAEPVSDVVPLHQRRATQLGVVARRRVVQVDHLRCSPGVRVRVAARRRRRRTCPPRSCARSGRGSPPCRRSCTHSRGRRCPRRPRARRSCARRTARRRSPRRKISPPVAP